MAKERLPAILLYPADWIEDEVSNTSLAAQGLWLRMMFLMHFSSVYGELRSGGRAMDADTIARRCGCELHEYTTLLAELDRHGVPGRRRDGAIYSRRMVKDFMRRNQARENGGKGGNPMLLRSPVNQPDNPTLGTKDNCALGMGMGNGSSEGESLREGIPESLNTPEFKDAWIEWQAHKREKRSKLTKRSAAMQLKKLEAIGAVRSVAAIQHSIASNYQGVFEDNRAPTNLPPRSSDRIKELLKNR